MWNWKLKDWPNFSYKKAPLQSLEQRFLQNSGEVLGVLKHIKNQEKDDLIVDILTNEAYKTSEIEGEYLNRESIQSSIKNNLGLPSVSKKITPAEFGISEMMVASYKNFEQPLSHQTLYTWHKMLTNGRQDLLSIGAYRSHKDAMQIVSGRIDKPHVHFEAPPSQKVLEEMNQFITWFNLNHTKNGSAHQPLALAGMTHFYFETIHPFEDGNGRIGRTLAEKSISLSLKRPALLSLSQTIEGNKKQYYTQLEAHNKTLDLTDWLVYFAETIVKAQENTIDTIEFLIKKARFFDAYASLLNARQAKVIKRMFEEGPQGFSGGLSAKNYQRITQTSFSTTTRDLKDLVEKKILSKTGELKGTRYWLRLK